ncbi:MAG: DMT family transporter [Deltaproteobacteria bacterium]|nr:DMT family transporter [Deltaproteobacteria bacterium]MBI3389256.1 DMT family transporter [Deltaproteobacteria bacterium]
MSWSPFLLALMSAVLFGAAAPAGKLLLRELPPLQTAALLYLGAGLGVLPAMLRGAAPRLPWPSARLQQMRLLGAIFCGGVVGPVLLLLALQRAAAGSVALWLALELAATAVLGRVFFRDYLSRSGWLGVAGTIAASALLCLGQGPAGVVAGALALAACVAWGLDNNLTALVSGLRPTQITCWKGVVAGAVNLVLSFALESPTVALRPVLAALAVGALAYGASIALYITAAQSLGAIRAQVLFASAPFFGLLLSAVALGEYISFLQITAAVGLMISLALVFRDRHLHLHSHEAIGHIHRHRHDDQHHAHPHPDADSTREHSHWHEHVPVTHTHPHWPDLHHRHTHED